MATLLPFDFNHIFLQFCICKDTWDHGSLLIGNISKIIIIETPLFLCVSHGNITETPDSVFESCLYIGAVRFHLISCT